MTRVYIVLETVDLGDHVVGVFDSRPKAEVLCNELETDRTDRYKNWLIDRNKQIDDNDRYIIFTPQHYIQEWEVL